MTEEQLEAAQPLPRKPEAGGYLGFMSGTSMDGVDAALLGTDGQRVLERGPFLSAPYPDEIREQIKTVLGSPDLDRDGHVAQAITHAHVTLADQLLASEVANGFLSRFPLTAIGFHGQTVFHDPARGVTQQIGVPAELHQAFDVPVVHDFRTADVSAGGQGAPLAPIYHHALCRDLEKPVAVLNLGGVANLTFMPDSNPETMLAFDCGPGNGLIDDWIFERTGQAFDQDGVCAANGQISKKHVEEFLSDPFFQVLPPKSLDRLAWSAELVSGLSVEDGAATLTAITASAVAAGLELGPAQPAKLIVCGGGRHNKTLMKMLTERTGSIILACEQFGWNGDSVEAEAFAFMAARRLKDLPSTFPGTTGVPAAMEAGQCFGI